MDIERLKCKECGKFPDGEIYECAAKEHIICVKCAEATQKVFCECRAKLILKKQRNPIEQLVQNTTTMCRYRENGCTWKFTATDMDSHVLECKFRPYRCIASTLNVLRCDWIGLQHEIEDHMLHGHQQLGPVFRFCQTSSLVFKGDISLAGLKLVDAFSKHFLFYFFSDAVKKTLSFMMIYFGRREESDQYCFDLLLRSLPEWNQAKGTESSPDTPVETGAGFMRTAKFVERCYSDSDNLTELLEEESCITLTHRQLQKYLYNGKLFFSFKIRKVEGTSKTTGEMEPLENTPFKQKPRPPPFKFAQKGKTPVNTKRSPSASSTASSSGSSKSSSSSDNSSSDKSQVASRTPSSASTLTMSSERGSVVGGAASAPVEKSLIGSPSLSSINRISGQISPFEKPALCALLTPSINKLDLPPTWEVCQTTTTNLMYQQSTEYRQMHLKDQPSVKRYPPAECTTTAAVCKEYTQPYKAQDLRPYLLKHPTNCLYKPTPKKGSFL